jgi:hypothetical protein
MKYQTIYRCKECGATLLGEQLDLVNYGTIDKLINAAAKIEMHKHYISGFEGLVYRGLGVGELTFLQVVFPQKG